MPDEPKNYEEVTEVSEEPWVPLHKDQWTDPERWAWEQVRTGRVADFNKRYGKDLDPKNEKLWNEKEIKHRGLRPDFLRTILLSQPWRGLITNSGVCIVGACFLGQVYLSNSEVDCELWLDASLLPAGLACSSTRFKYSFSLDGSNLSQQLTMDGASVKGSLFMRKGKFKAVRLHGVQVGGQLSMNEVVFEEELAMDGASVKGGLFMRKGKFKAVRLHGVQVGGQLDMKGAEFQEELTMDGAEVKGDLFMRDGRFKSVRLPGIEVGGDLSAIGAGFSGLVLAEGAQIGGNIFFRRTRFFGSLNLAFCRVGASLTLAGAWLEEMDISGATIKGELALHQPLTKGPPGWGPSSLDLCNTSVGWVADREDAWPRCLLLDGFRYERFAVEEFNPTEKEKVIYVAAAVEKKIKAFVEKIQKRIKRGEKISKPEAERKRRKIARKEKEKATKTIDQLTHDHQTKATTMAQRSGKWFVRWLARQKEFSLDPYRQCARVLREAGHPDKANEVLYAGLERERMQMRARSLPRAGRTILKWTIGYGLGYRYFRALIWALLALVVGGVICGSAGGAEHGPLFCFGFSLDNMIPLIDMRPEHEAMSRSLSGFAKFYFLFFQQLVGWVLLLCVAAGLAGVGKPGGRES